MSILGNRVVRLEDPRFLRGKGLYVENLELEGALCATFVRSPLAHARVNAVDASAAEELPNVHVFTGADVDAHPFGPPPHWHITAGMERPLLARDVVRFAGDIVAVVVSENRASGLDAAELVMVDYDPLPAVLSVEDAASRRRVALPGGRVERRQPGGTDEPDDGLFDGCDLVVSGVLVSQRLAAAPLEPRSAAAVVGDDGRLTLWATSQTPHTGKMVVAGLLGLEPGQVRVVSPDVGGGFGAKMIEPEAVLVAWLARALGRPVRWTETRSESMLGLPHGRGQRLSFTLGGTRAGKLLAYRLEVLGDGGAYPALGAYLPNMTALMSNGVYAIPKVETRTVRRDQYDADDLDPGRRPTGGDAGDRAGDRPLRGGGRPRPGRDPAQELHRRGRLPVPDRRGRDVRLRRLRGGARPCAALRGLRGAAGRAAASPQRRPGTLELGIGISLRTPRSRTPLGEERSTARSRSPPTAAQSCAPGLVLARPGTRDDLRDDRGRAPRSYDVEDRGRPGRHRRRAEGHRHVRIEVDADRRHGRQGRGRRRGGRAREGARRQITWRRASQTSSSTTAWDGSTSSGHHYPRSGRGGARRARAAGRRPARRAEGRSTTSRRPRRSRSGVHVAVVEVDVETGKVELLRHITVDDAGTLLNPLIVEGQVTAASRRRDRPSSRISVRRDGNPLPATLVGYDVPVDRGPPAGRAIEWRRPRLPTSSVPRESASPGRSARHLPC